MSAIKAVIVEDSRLARNELKALLKGHLDIELVGEAENVDDGLDLIQKEAPDLLFLDINMPEKDGFELLEMLDEVPITVFTTAFDEYAIKSFEYNALDYLLNPISEDRFGKALDKVRVKLAGQQSEESTKEESGRLSNSSQIFIKDGESCWLVRIEEIQLFEIVGNYTRVHFQTHSPLLYKSLQQIEDKLPEAQFFRANRQQIVNTEFIDSITPWFNGKLKLKMINGEEVEVSRRQSAQFKDKMSF
jgi:two-component system LytT family response regulator